MDLCEQGGQEVTYPVWLLERSYVAKSNRSVVPWLGVSYREPINHWLNARNSIPLKYADQSPSIKTGGLRCRYCRLGSSLTGTTQQELERERSRSLCQRCRWQVTAKPTCTLPYICGLDWSEAVKWCLIGWCAQNVRRIGSSFRWHHPSNNQIVLSVHQFGGCSKCAVKRQISYSEPYATWAQLVCSRAGNSAKEKKEKKSG